ncbi:MAG TPA: efflux RND transporter periplasmic adaptor subunit, partial [Thermoanaerobaculia bacterium]
VAEAEALFEQAADEHRRAEALFEKRSVTRSALVEAKTARDVAEARLASARLRLQKSRVAAPWAGTVAARRVEVGDYVAPGQAMFELVDARRLKVRAPVPATDVPFVAVGEPVEIEVSSLPGERFEGRVARLAAELDPGARTLDLEAELDNTDGRLKPGMLARLRIPRQVLTDALLVPLDAVVDLEETRAVYVVAGGAELRAERREVTLGPTLGERVVIESGLAPGDRVIVEGQSRVAPGQRVEVVVPEGAP